jgi:hypothetical protein
MPQRRHVRFTPRDLESVVHGWRTVRPGEGRLWDRPAMSGALGTLIPTACPFKLYCQMQSGWSDSSSTNLATPGSVCSIIVEDDHPAPNHA